MTLRETIFVPSAIIIGVVVIGTSRDTEHLLPVLESIRGAVQCARGILHVVILDTRVAFIPGSPIALSALASTLLALSHS